VDQAADLQPATVFQRTISTVLSTVDSAATSLAPKAGGGFQY
jgi:hypothetical protein